MNDLTRKYPAAEIAWWCNYEKDVVEVAYDNMSDTKEFERDLERAILLLGGRKIRKNITDSKLQLVVRCSCTLNENSSSLLIGRHNCLLLYPVIYTDGWEWFRVIALSQKDMKGLFSDLGDLKQFQILSKKVVDKASVRDTFVVSISSLTGGLTESQTGALLLALTSGYYSVPKQVKTEEIASKMGISRTTFEEHLRKAESKVLKSVTPYLHFSVGKCRSASQERRLLRMAEEPRERAGAVPLVGTGSDWARRHSRVRPYGVPS